MLLRKSAFARGSGLPADTRTDMWHVHADMSADLASLPRTFTITIACQARSAVPVLLDESASMHVLPSPKAAAPPQADELDRELQFGPGIRVQRFVAAAFLLAAVFMQDLRFAYVTFVLTLLEAMSPRWVPVAQVVARFVRFGGEHRIGDLYFDLRGLRGASAISVFVQAAGIGLVWAGQPMAGFMVLTVPTASFLMAPTLGFCAGCWFYVLGRDWLVRRGWLRSGCDDCDDISIGDAADTDQPELRASAQR
ncbi:MAG TPA: DUF4395 family protein [Burkholderiaceae bacterium]|nr:DUF4395 family protein [Burkholderiaceae bacterium]